MAATHVYVYVFAKTQPFPVSFLAEVRSAVEKGGRTIRTTQVLRSRRRSVFNFAYALFGQNRGHVGSQPILVRPCYVIEPLDLDSPVFFVEIKPPIHLPYISIRKDAENQARTWFVQLAHLVRTPKLYGVSALSSTAQMKEPAVLSNLLPWGTPPPSLWTLPLLRGGTRISWRKRGVPSSWPQ